MQTKLTIGCEKDIIIIMHADLDELHTRLGRVLTEARKDTFDEESELCMQLKAAKAVAKRHKRYLYKKLANAGEIEDKKFAETRLGRKCPGIQPRASSIPPKKPTS